MLLHPTLSEEIIKTVVADNIATKKSWHQGPVLLSRRVARRNFLRHDGVCATSQLNASY